MRERTLPTDLLISVDVEADGPVPGRGSLSSLGAVVAGTLDARGGHVPSDLSERFYVELAPDCDVFDPESLAVSGLDRDALVAHGTPAGDGLRAFAGWVEGAAAGGGGRPVFCAYPLGFDWLWVYSALGRHGIPSPFGHSRCLDIKTLFAARSGGCIATAVKRNMPRSFFDAGTPHTHNALDDAVEQGLLLQRLLVWPGRAPAGAVLEGERGEG